MGLEELLLLAAAQVQGLRLQVSSLILTQENGTRLEA